MGTILEVQDLKKYFKTPRGWLHAVDGVNFSVNAGETLGIVGESGCGKSTLGRTILHLVEPTSGKIIFDGEDISKIGKRKFKELRKEMQIIFQDPFSSLNPRMTVEDIIREPLEIYHVLPNTAETDKRVHEIMDTVGLAQRLARSYPHELDGGRRQRIGVARALALDPKFIVCDEPVSALDVSIQAQILNLMQDLQEEKGLTYIFITHDLSVVHHIANDICVMYLGQMVEKASAKELFENNLHPYTKALLSAIPVPNPHAKSERMLLKGEITSPINPKKACRFAPRCPYATDVCRGEEPQLEEISTNHFVACHRVREVNGL
mgnify:CR=1 FL=1